MGRAPCCEKVGLKRGRWTAEEDELLTKYIQANGEGSWRSLPKIAGTKFNFSLLNEFILLLLHFCFVCLISLNDISNLGVLTFEGLLRCGKSCRLRWINYLRGDLKRGNISDEEESLIVKLHASFGNRFVTEYISYAYVSYFHF